ncbi:endogenous retrovirus group K member 5 Gag polyprotein-like [Cuculus canorus]|uniref:endogenous retrovirus group K member 5 Gag polyprotein-like n=1 Tax=Cuculus canorus TaxID=55661 RepID=UPI0023AA7FA8|nr:endogenous retrovirus group K member 5 Gag polyprotein-like [Cuculus canorus]
MPLKDHEQCNKRKQPIATEVCPWFPKDGTINIDTWNRVGDKIQGYYTVHGPEKVPIDAFTLWSLVKECLRGDTGDEKWETKNSQELTPDDWDNLEDQAARYHQDQEGIVLPVLKEIDSQTHAAQQPPVVLPAFRDGTWPPPPGPEELIFQQSPMQLALKKAREAGEILEGFQVYPVVQRQQATGALFNDYEPIPFKQLKELKIASAQYGPTAPFTVTILETIAAHTLPPSDWKSLAKAVLSGGEYLLWSSEYSEQCAFHAQTLECQQLGITYDILAGAGNFTALHQQLNFRPQAYDIIRQSGLIAWKRLPKSGTRKEELSKVKQGPDESYQDFVARLLQISSKLIEDSDAALILVKELAFENANSVCQSTLRPWKGRATLNDYVKLCADIGPSYVQGITLAAALKGQSIEQAMAVMRGGQKLRR